MVIQEVLAVARDEKHERWILQKKKRGSNDHDETSTVSDVDMVLDSDQTHAYERQWARLCVYPVPDFLPVQSVYRHSECPDREQDTTDFFGP